jgi:hypothetical protein
MRNVGSKVYLGKPEAQIENSGEELKNVALRREQRQRGDSK